MVDFAPPWIFLSALVSWTLWRLSFRFLNPRLKNIPGPSRTSILTGNYVELFNRYAWDFYDTIGRVYGPVLTLHGALGSRLLYVFDPKALEVIVSKDSTAFEESECFLLCILLPSSTKSSL